MMPRYSIRPACEYDAVEIARLASQLGYPAPEDAIRKRLQQLLASPNDIVFVAEFGDSVLAGWIHGVLSQFLESDFRIEIGGLVVDERFHRKGIGRDLVEQVEIWAVGRGVEHASVRCRTSRTEAHLFYESLGYSPAKTQIVFRKRLAKTPEANCESNPPPRLRPGNFF